MHLKAKIRGAIEEALTGLHSSSEKGKQCLTTFDYGGISESIDN